VLSCSVICALPLEGVSVGIRMHSAPWRMAAGRPAFFNIIIKLLFMPVSERLCFRLNWPDQKWG